MKKSNRIQLELAEKSMERLNSLKEKTECKTYTEVVKNALRLYENIIYQHEAGKQFFLKDENGNITEYLIF